MQRAVHVAEQVAERLVELVGVIGQVDDPPAVRRGQHRDDQQRREHDARRPLQPAHRLACVAARRGRPRVQPEQHQPAEPAERDRRQLGADREPEGETHAERVHQPARLEPALDRVHRQQAGRGRGYVERGERAVPDEHRGRRRQERRQQCAGAPEHRASPQVGHADQQRQERQRPGPRERQVQVVVAAAVEDRDPLRHAVRRRLALRAGAGEVGTGGQHQPGERWVLDVVVVVAPVEQRHAGGEVLRLVPGVAVDMPGRCGQPAAEQHQQRDGGQRQQAGTGGVRHGSGPFGRARIIARTR